MKRTDFLKNPWVSCLLTVLVMVFWGALFPLIKLAYKTVPVDSSSVPSLLLFAGVRFVICGAVLLLIAALRRDRIRLLRADLPRLASVAVFAVVLHYACTYVGLSFVDSGKTALLKQLGVLFFICFSFLFIKEEKFEIPKLAGGILGMGGIIVLNVGTLSFGGGVGEWLVIGASLCTVISNLSGKRLSGSMPPLSMAGWSQLLGGAVLTVIGLAFGGRLPLPGVAGFGIMAAIVACSVLGYGLWYLLLREGDLSRMFILKFLEPLFAGLFGFMILGEDIFNWRYLAALGLTLAAILVSHLKIKSKKPEQGAPEEGEK